MTRVSFLDQGVATHVFRVGVTIRVTIYELKSKSTLRYHFCFAMPTVDEVLDDCVTLGRNANGLVKTRSLVCFEDAASEPEAGAVERPRLADMCRESMRSFESEASAVGQNIGASTFCRAFPWHFMVDRGMQFVQLGVGFMRLFGSDLKRKGRHLGTYFELKKPLTEPNFERVLKKANSPFVLALCHVNSRKAQVQVGASFLFAARERPIYRRDYASPRQPMATRSRAIARAPLIATSRKMNPHESSPLEVAGGARAEKLPPPAEGASNPR